MPGDKTTPSVTKHHFSIQHIAKVASVQGSLLKRRGGGGGGGGGERAWDWAKELARNVNFDIHRIVQKIHTLTSVP